MSAITPRISDIPKGKSSSDYKVCNIVDFRGINCAENPLDIKLGEASDMKNLYVNDELSLTTRPRLGWIKTLGDFSKILYDDETILFGLDSNKNYKCLYNGEACSFEDASFDLDKWSIFKNSKGTYFLTCNKGYYYLDVSNVSNYTFKNVIYSEEAYIPTTKIGKSFLDENAGTEYEQRNLLSKKYKESYLFNLQDTVIPNNFKNEKIDLKNVFEVAKSSDDANIPGAFKDSEPITVTSPSGKYKLELRPNGGNPPGYYITIIDYENQKYISVTDNTNNDFYNFVTTYHNTYSETDFKQSQNLDLYFLLGIDSSNNYVIYVIKTGWLKPLESGFTSTVLTISLFGFTVDNTSGKIIEIKQIYGPLRDSTNKEIKYGNFKVNPILKGSKKNEYYKGLKFFLKNDFSTEIYFCDVQGLYYPQIRVKDVGLLNSNDFEWYSMLFRDYNCEAVDNGSYDIVDYYNNLFFYRYKNNCYILQQGILDSKYIQSTNHDEYTLTDGSFYGVYIPDSYGELKRYEFINDGVLLIFNTETFYLKINKSCPKNQILNSQTNTTGDIFKFKYDENLLDYENSLYSLADIPSGYIYFLRDNIKKFIYYENGQYYLTSDITEKDAVNNIKITLDSSQEFLGKEAYFDNKKIVLTTETKETDDTHNTIKITKNFITITYDPSAYNLLDVERSYTDEVDYSHDFSKVSIFDDKYWFYRSETEPNLIRYSYDTTGLYIPENSYDDIGDSSPITSIMQITDSYLGIFKENSAFTVTEDDETSDLYYVQTLKTELGNVPVGQTIVTSYTNNPLVINSYGIYGLGQNKNILETDSVFYSITDKITSKYIKIKNKQNIKTHNHRFYTYFYYSENNITKIWVLDNRFNAWYYWELPLSSIDYIYDKVYDLDNADEVLTYIWSGNKLYMLTTSYYGILGNGNDSNFGASDIIGYQDYLNSDKGAYKRIEWYWKTPPLILQTINYLKKIVDMSMLFADAERETMYDSIHHKLIYGPGTDYKNNLELFYDIKTYRKKSMLLNGSYKGHIDYVSNARVKPRCQKCDFAALTLYNKIVKDGDNITYTYDNSNSDNEGYNNGYDIIDKLNLIGLTFKVVLS